MTISFMHFDSALVVGGGIILDLGVQLIIYKGRNSNKKNMVY